VKLNILETENSLIVSIPKKRSWFLIIVFSLLFVQSLYGLIRVILFPNDLLLIELLIIFLVCPLIIFLTLKWILWQIKGLKIMEIDFEKLIYKRLSPFRSKINEYAIKDIKSINIKNESGTVGLTRLLQQMCITDPVHITIKIGFDTIETIGGFSYDQASQLIEILNRKIEKNID
jgi:hypothetical protein